MKRLDRDIKDLNRQEKEIGSQIGFRRDTLIGWIKRASEEVDYLIIITFCRDTLNYWMDQESFRRIRLFNHHYFL